MKKTVVRSWNYKTPNWIYVVLSRVRILTGLFIYQKLSVTKKCNVDQKLIQEEERIRRNETELVIFFNNRE